MPCTARWPRGVWCRRGWTPPKVARFGLVLGCNHVMPSSSVRQEGTDVDAYHGGPRRRVQPQPVYFRRHNQDSRNQNGPGLHGRKGLCKRVRTAQTCCCACRIVVARHAAACRSQAEKRKQVRAVIVKNRRREQIALHQEASRSLGRRRFFWHLKCVTGCFFTSEARKASAPSALRASATQWGPKPSVTWLRASNGRGEIEPAITTSGLRPVHGGGPRKARHTGKAHHCLDQIWSWITSFLAEVGWLTRCSGFCIA